MEFVGDEIVIHPETDFFVLHYLADPFFVPADGRAVADGAGHEPDRVERCVAAIRRIRVALGAGQAVIDPLADFPGLDEPGLLQDGEVFRGGGGGEV